MEKREQILLDYIIKKSYEDQEAQEVLDKYAAERVRQPTSIVSLINSLIRSGNTRLASQFAAVLDRKTQNKSGD